MTPNDEENEWEQPNRTNWRGLGLTDPIKSVEVRVMRLAYLNTIHTLSTRTNGFCYLPSSRSKALSNNTSTLSIILLM